MPEEIMTQETGSQTVESQTEETIEDDVSAAYEAFGITPKEAEETETDASQAEETPAATQTKTDAEKKGITVKFNKEDVAIDEEKIPEYVQKGLALDKERERVKQSQTDLDRAAKLLGYKDHAELSANLDRIEQDREKQQKDQFEQMKQKVIVDLIYNGVDEQAAREYAESNPLVQQARQALQEREADQQERQKAVQTENWVKEWSDLYTAFPNLSDSSKLFDEGGKPDWYTAEMASMVGRGYTPKDAYTLLNMDKIQTQTKKQTEQQLIKERRLGLRAQVETDVRTEAEPTVDPEVESAFSLFGIPVRNAKKYAKK